MIVNVEVTEKDLLFLKKKAEEGKRRLIEAETTLKEVVSNIKTYKDELSDKGIDPDNPEESISERAAEINALYADILQAFPS